MLKGDDDRLKNLHQACESSYAFEACRRPTILLQELTTSYNKLQFYGGLGDDCTSKRRSAPTGCSILLKCSEIQDSKGHSERL